MKKLNLKSLALAGIAVAVFSSGAAASSVTYVTPSGSSQGGQPVDATVSFQTNDNGTISITLTNLEANPTSVIQNISDLFFTLSNGTTGSAVLTSSSAPEVNIAGDGSTTPGTTGSTTWGLSTDLTSEEIHLNDLGFGGPQLTIVGPAGPGGVYTNANGSIAGNGPHNPFIDQTATFLITVPLVTSNTTVTGAVFSFGTEAGSNTTGVCPTGAACTPPPPPVPEPASLALVGSGLALAARRLRRKKA